MTQKLDLTEVVKTFVEHIANEHVVEAVLRCRKAEAPLCGVRVSTAVAPATAVITLSGVSVEALSRLAESLTGLVQKFREVLQEPDLARLCAVPPPVPPAVEQAVPKPVVASVASPSAQAVKPA